MLKNLLLCLIALTATALPSWAASARFILELAGPPAIVAEARGRAAVERRRNEIDAEQRAARALVQRAGGRVRGSVDTVANAIFIEIEEAEAARLRNSPGVLRLTRSVTLMPRLDRVLALSKVPEAWALIGGADKAGQGVKIAILDTGIDHKHPGFIDDSLNVPEGYPKASKDANLEFTSKKVIVARSYESLNEEEAFGSDARDGNGHGTNAGMAAAGIVHNTPIGIISGVAPKAFLGNYKVLGNKTGGSNEGILKGIDDAVKDGMDILNLSLGSDAVPEPSKDPLVQAIERAVEGGRIVLVAAGNSGPDPNSIGSPATAPSAISVGSSSSDRELDGDKATPIDPKRLSVFSSRGPNLGPAMKPDMLATGDNFYTAQSQDKDPANLYKVTQGTSFATPTVAGAAAVLKAARPGLAEPVYRSLLVNSSVPLVFADGSAAPMRSQGAGVLNLEAALTSTIAAAPVSLKFGVAGATASIKRTITLTNTGTAGATFEIAAIDVDGRGKPGVNINSLNLDPGAAAPVEVTLEGAGLSGEYQGYIRVSSSLNGVVAFVPYWYAVESTTPAAISLLEPPSEGKAGSEARIMLRIVDASGVALPDAPLEVSPGGQIARDPDYPGLVVVSLVLAAGDNTVELRSGEVSRKIVITGN